MFTEVYDKRHGRVIMWMGLATFAATGGLIGVAFLARPEEMLLIVPAIVVTAVMGTGVTAWRAGRYICRRCGQPAERYEGPHVFNYYEAVCFCCRRCRIIWRTSMHRPDSARRRPW